MADTSAGWLWSRVIWISNKWRGTDFDLWSRYHSRSSPKISGKVLCAKTTYSWRVFPHKMDSGNPITSFSVINLQSIAAATMVTDFPRPISSATSLPGISASQNQFLMMNQMAQTWCSRNIVPRRLGIEYLWPGTLSSIEWRTGWAFCSLTASSTHSCWNSLLIVLSTVINSELVFAGSRTSSPSTTCPWISLEPLSVFFSSSMMTFSCSYVSWEDGLIFRCSWNSSQCDVFHS